MTQPAPHEFTAVHDPDGATRLRIGGYLVVGNRDEYKQLVVEHLAKGDRAFVLDLTRCGYIDAAGLGAIVSTSRKVAAADGTFRVVGLNPDLRTLFELTRLDQFLLISDSRTTYD